MDRTETETIELLTPAVVEAEIVALVEQARVGAADLRAAEMDVIRQEMGQLDGWCNPVLVHRHFTDPRSCGAVKMVAHTANDADVTCPQCLDVRRI